MKINDIWIDMENDKSFSTGLLLRRYTGSFIPAVFVALKAPEKIRCIVASVSEDVNLNLAPISNLKDIIVEIMPDNTHTNKKLLLFGLRNSKHIDIFSVLCEDLMTSIENVKTEPSLIKELFNRFEKWKSLFQTAGLEGLSANEQIGLYGELYLLRKLLQITPNQLAVLDSWVGCEKQIQDFQYDRWSIEVKTTHGNNHQRIQISNERQLDSSKIENLFLFHLSIDVRPNTEETLNDIVQWIRDFLDSDIRSINRFNTKLIEGGYFDHHELAYKNTGYIIRDEVFYKVENNFPRIEEKDIRYGVGDINYTIIVSDTTHQYTRSEIDVLKVLNYE